MRDRCAVRGLLYGDCPAPPDGARSDGLCLYHGKLEDRLTSPPGDYVDNPEFPSTAHMAQVSYRGSTHPQYGGMVDTGGYVGESVAA